VDQAEKVEEESAAVIQYDEEPKEFNDGGILKACSTFVEPKEEEVHIDGIDVKEHYSSTYRSTICKSAERSKKILR
jgi:hypothetical protein